MAKVNRRHRGAAANTCPAPVPYAFPGHPSVEQLMAEQGTGPITDVSMLHGDFWPKEETVEEFLATLREWRGHERTYPSA